ncbi:hypothetical protein Tco_1457110 [Tanacetum coccineum]
MYMSSWDKSYLESYKEKCEKLEKENEKYIITFSSLYDNDKQYTKKIKEQEDSLDTMNGQLVELKNTVKIKQTTISELKDYLRKKDSENEHLKSKIVDFTTVQNLRTQVKELQSENEHLKSKVVDFTTLSKARALTEATLRERDELISDQCKKMRLLEEQYEPFYEVQSEFDSEIVHDTYDNSEKDVNLSLQTQLKETIELVVCFSNEKYYVLKETESLKVEIKSLQTENKVLKLGEFELSEKIDQMKSQVLKLSEKLHISNQEMKQQIIKYNDLLASNDDLKHRLETKFKFLKNDNSLEKMFEMIEQEYASNVSKISITSSTFETKNLELVKEMADKVKCFDEEKKAFETKISKLEKVLAQQVKDFDDVKIELSIRTDKFETYFVNLEK